MAVIETRRLHQRKNGMANIFTGIDITEIEHLASLAASGSTSSSSIPSSNSTGAPAVHVSYGGASLNCDDSNDHASDDNHEDGSDSQDR